MKKCILCAVLICLILIGCTAVTNQPTTGPQMNVTTTSSTATTILATNSTVTTVPPASSTVATTPSVTTIPTTVTTTGTTTVTTTTVTTVPATTTQQTTTKVYVDYACVFIGHRYENGNCIYCGRKQAAGDVGATQPTTSRPAYLCAMGDHEIKDGYCIHCGRIEPKDVDGTLIVNGIDITEGNYVKVNEGHNNSKLPLTAILTALDIDWKWESDTLLRIDLKGEDMVLDLDHPQFDWTVPPGTLGGVRWVIDGEVIVDGTSLKLLLRNLDIIMTTDYDTNTVLIARVMP